MAERSVCTPTLLTYRVVEIVVCLDINYIYSKNDISREDKNIL
jgi:hypothetical protein